MIPNTKNATGQQKNKSACEDSSSNEDFIEIYNEQIQKKKEAERTKQITIPLRHRKLAAKSIMSTAQSVQKNPPFFTNIITTETNTKSTASKLSAIDTNIEGNNKRVSAITLSPGQESPLNQKRLCSSIPDPLINVAPFSTFVDKQLSLHNVAMLLL